MDIERLKELYEKVLYQETLDLDEDGARYTLQDLVSDEIARQSVTSEEVAEAIEQMAQASDRAHYYQDSNHVKLPVSLKAIDLAITALQAYEPTTRKDRTVEEVAISKTETTSCEWCEIASACEYEVTFFKDDDRWATERSLLPKYCPNCGRKIRED